MLDLSTVRIRRYNEQRGRCLYCRNPMWEEAIEPQGIALIRILRIRVEKSYDCLQNLSSFACTAEHLLPQSQGGTDEPENIAAACKLCNNGRDQETVSEWQVIVATRQRELVQGNDDVPRTDGQWATERYIFKWNHVLHIEAPKHEVKMFAVTLDGALRPFGYSHVQDSMAVIYPTFDGDTSPLAREHHFTNRKVITGTRILLESAEHAAAIADHFADKVVSFTNREAPDKSGNPVAVKARGGCPRLVLEVPIFFQTPLEKLIHRCLGWLGIDTKR